MTVTRDDTTQKRRFSFSVPPALTYPAYRNYWFGTLASVAGFQMFQQTQLWLVHSLDDSLLILGSVGVAQAVPAIILNLFGGVFADKLDKRRLIMITQSIIAGLIFLLATLTLTDLIQIWHVFAIAFVTGAVNAFDQPARQAIYPHLIDRKAMMSAVALNSSIWQGTRIIAPAFAGVMIAYVGIAESFYLAGIGFAAMALVMAALTVPRIERGATGSAARDMLEGVIFIRRNSIFSFLIGMTFFNSFFGMAYVIMMPVFAVEILDRGAQEYGVLLSAGGVGSLMVTLWLGSRSTIGKNRGLLVIGGATMFGIAVATFALTSEYIGNYYVAIAILFIMGTFNSLYMVNVQSSLQMMVPDNMRGRVMGFYGMTWSIMPLSGIPTGAIANLIGLPIAIAIGGFAVAGFALGPAAVNKRVRGLGTLLQQFERGLSSPKSDPEPVASADGDD